MTVTRRFVRKNKYVQFTGEYHLDLLLRFGAVPIMVPAVAGAASVLKMYFPAHGLLLVEGEDVNPDRYGLPSNMRRLIQEPDLIKDRIEFSLVRFALKHKIPYLGICKGSHVLNVACGGTLYADVMKEKGTTLKHINYDNYDGYRHHVRVLKNTPLHHWYRKTDLNVTTYHHQGVKKLAKRFLPMAHSDDGLIEGFYDPKEDFLMGLQFHPERMLKEYAGNPKVFQAFARAAKKYAGKKS